ncbi:efflux RND transporter periplasmic adaptor subunit [Phaeovulum vinaykumarii]|uniref:RND family efflux transporter, MFP subunit n=1 Tax=Phaeovulum vinaykumarii TaxID=407234 RepID=A0A1N7KAA1_9RHOB|nr:efflux RND transporter periplasmic adaptor subunit [Phaeovulum vinaykumarii]SIS58459.1 RND family efflux transporter, MFP subunit [Phaeovulum vinaykumarii]SOB93804.1 RND family efflux transporter MFP subunit [Phaeovulum vinaykumarii]
MRFLGRGLMGLFGLAMTLAFLAIAGWQVVSALQARSAAKTAPPVARERLLAAPVALYQPGLLAPEIVTHGEMRAWRRLELRAAAAGRIVETAEGFVDGGRVEEGTLLAQVDPAEARAARDTAAAALIEARAAAAEAERALTIAADDLTAARAQVELRRAALERAQTLDARGIGRTADVETAQLALSAAEQAVLNRRAALSQAEATRTRSAAAADRAAIALREAERTLADTEIRAPFAGRLSGVDVVAGNLVQRNERLGELIDPRALEVAFRVSTAQFARLAGPGGQLPRLELTVNLPGGPDVPARLERVDPAVADGQTGRLLYARLDRPMGLQPGDFVTVRLHEPELPDVARLPAVAVVPDPGGRTGTVLVLGPEDRLESASVRIIRRQGDDVIVEAPLAGREVVQERTPLLGAGLKLRPIRDGQPPAEDTTGMIRLDPERRARLLAYLESARDLPEAMRARAQAALEQDLVPEQMIARIESRMGG